MSLDGFGAAWARCMVAAEPVSLIRSGDAHVPYTAVQFCERVLEVGSPQQFIEIWSEGFATWYREATGR